VIGSGGGTRVIGSGVGTRVIGSLRAGGVGRRGGRRRGRVKPMVRGIGRPTKSSPFGVSGANLSRRPTCFSCSEKMVLRAVCVRGTVRRGGAILLGRGRVKPLTSPRPVLMRLPPGTNPSAVPANLLPSPSSFLWMKPRSFPTSDRSSSIMRSPTWFSPRAPCHLAPKPDAGATPLPAGLRQHPD